MTKTSSSLFHLQDRSLEQLTERQILHNHTTADHWSLFRSHREEISRLIIQEKTPKNSRLCVLGAGNCNDLDLTLLRNFFSEIHLVDLDCEALLAGVARQHATDFPGLRLHCGVDVTGILKNNLRPNSRKMNIQGEDRWTHQNRVFSNLAFLGTFDIVISTCLLTQLFDSGAFLLRPQNFPVKLFKTLRMQHLLLLAELLNLRGVGILVTALSSSTIIQDLANVPSENLPVLLNGLIHQDLTFRGTNPRKIISMLEANPLLSSLVHQVQLASPWIWNLTPRLCFIVSAIRFKRRAVLKVEKPSFFL